MKFMYDSISEAITEYNLRNWYSYFKKMIIKRANN